MNLCRVIHLKASFCVNVINELFITVQHINNLCIFLLILQRSGKGITVLTLLVSKTSNGGWSFLFISSSKGLKQLNTLTCSTSTSRTRTTQSNLMAVTSSSLGRNVLGGICKSGFCGLCIAKLWKFVCWIIAADPNQCSIWPILSFLSRHTPTMKLTLSPTIRNRMPYLTASMSSQLNFPPIWFWTLSTVLWDTVTPMAWSRSYTLRKNYKYNSAFVSRNYKIAVFQFPLYYDSI